MQEAWVRSLGWEDPLEKGKLPTPVFCTVHGIAKSWTRLSNFHFQCICVMFCKWHYFILFYGWVLFHCFNIYIPHLHYPFICQWISRLFPFSAIVNSVAMNTGVRTLPFLFFNRATAPDTAQDSELAKPHPSLPSACSHPHQFTHHTILEADISSSGPSTKTRVS